nr:hypothetical protein [Mycolicibacterium porcinum]
MRIEPRREQLHQGGHEVGVARQGVEHIAVRHGQPGLANEPADRAHQDHLAPRDTCRNDQARIVVDQETIAARSERIGQLVLAVGTPLVRRDEIEHCHGQRQVGSCDRMLPRHL